MTKATNPLLNEVNSTIFNYDQWRIRFSRVVLWIICGLGIFLLLAIFPSSSTTELITFSVVYTVLLAVAVISLPYKIKAGAVITTGYFVSLYTLVRFGPWSDSTIFFLATTFFTALLFDERFDRWIFTICILSLLTMGVLDVTARFRVIEQGFPPLDTYDWLTYIADYAVLALAGLWAINLLKAEFNKVAKQFRTALFFINKDRSELEKRVDERTAGLLKKTEQLRAASYIARQTAEIKDLRTILGLVSNLVTDQFGYYHTGIYLVNEAEDEVILQAASSEGGKRMIQKGHSFKISSKNIVGLTVSNKKAHIVMDAGADPVFFNNSELPKTRSELAVPLMLRERVLGVLDIHSEQPQAFSDDEVSIVQTLADQVAITIENMRLLEDARTALKLVETMTNLRTRETWQQKTREQNFSYTYTPLGLQTGKILEDSEQSFVVPITLRGQKIGSISIMRKDNIPWSNIDMDVINEVAFQTGLAVDNVRLVEEATERAAREQFVGELASRFSQLTDIDGLLQTAARELGQMADVAEVSVYIGHVPEQIHQRKRTKRTTD